LSLPLVAAIVVLGALGVGAFFVYLGRIPIKLIAIAGLVALVSVWAVLKSIVMLFRTKESDPGEELDLTGEPQLKAELEAVAREVQTRPVDRVFVTQGTDMAVFERGSALATLRGKGERCLILGVGLLDGFRLKGFRSVLAHEYGHFKNAPLLTWSSPWREAELQLGTIQPGGS
jgi:Zn-dependent protease with chaperone function